MSQREGHPLLPGGSQEYDTHHILPTSRFPDKNKYRGSRKGSNASWNLRRVRRDKHDSWHFLFRNRFPKEVIELLRSLEYKDTGAIDAQFFWATTPSRIARRVMAWINLFGDSHSIKNAIEVIRDQWNLDDDGRHQWWRLRQRMEENGDCPFSHADARDGVSEL